MKKYVWNIFLSLDQFVNTVLGGDPDETISSRLGKWNKLGQGCRYQVARPICKVLNIVDENHCETSMEADEGENSVIP